MNSYNIKSLAKRLYISQTTSLASSLQSRALPYHGCSQRESVVLHAQHIFHVLDIRRTCLLTLLHPSFNRLPPGADSLPHNVPSLLSMDSGHVPSLLNSLSSPYMPIRDGWKSLLVLPEQVGHVSHRNRQNYPPRSNTHRQRNSCPEKDVSVSANDTSGHCCNEDVERAWHELLSRLRWWC